MEKSFADLLSDAFEETSGLSFPNEDLDFESFEFKEDGAVLTSDKTVVQEENIENIREHSQLDYTSSEEECDEDYAEIEEKLKDFSASVFCSINKAEASTLGQSLDQDGDNLGENKMVELEDDSHNLQTMPSCMYDDEQQTFNTNNIPDVEFSARQEDYTSSEDDTEEVYVIGQPLSQHDNGRSQVRQQDGTIVDQKEEVCSSTCSYDKEDEICDATNIQDVEVSVRLEDYTSSEEECEQTEEMTEDFVATGHCSKNNKEILTIGHPLAQVRHQDRGKIIVNKEEVSPLLETTSTCFYEKEEEIGVQDVEVSSRQEDYTSSEEEFCENEAEIEQKLGGFVETIHCSNDKKEVFAIGQSLAQNDNDQVHEEEEMDEGHFESIPGVNFMIEENDSDSDEEEEETEEDAPKTTFFQVEYTLEYPEISYDTVEDPNDDECIDTMEDFSGEEHQEAGESFAEYPSDFSSCEYVENTEKDQETNSGLKLDCMADNANNTEMNVAHMERDGDNNSDISEQKHTEKLESKEMFLDQEDENVCRDGHSELYNHLKDDNQELCHKIPKKQDDKPSQSWTADVFSTCGISEEDQYTKSYNLDNTGPNATWELDTATSLNSDDIEKLVSYYYQNEGGSGTKSCSSRGSVDDSFFFNSDPEESEVTEEGQLGDDEFEEDRKWEQERIEAFYKFYDDGDEDSGREERKIKVQFCTEALSQVIHYNTDSSDDSSRDSLSSSSDQDEEDVDPDSLKPHETEPCPSQSPASEPALSNQGPPEPEDLSDTETCGYSNLVERQEIKQNKQISVRKNKCRSVLKIILCLFLVVAMGLLMFWWVTDAAEWPGFPL